MPEKEPTESTVPSIHELDASPPSDTDGQPADQPPAGNGQTPWTVPRRDVPAQPPAPASNRYSWIGFILPVVALLFLGLFLLRSILLYVAVFLIMTLGVAILTWAAIGAESVILHRQPLAKKISRYLCLIGGVICFGYLLYIAYGTPARVEFRTLQNAAGETTTDSSFVVHFSKPIFKYQLSKLLEIYPGTDYNIQWRDTIIPLPFVTTVDIIPDQVLQQGTEYTVQFISLRDIFGRTLPNTTLICHTAVPFQTDYFSIVNFVPADGATGVRLDSQLNLRFNFPVQTDTFIYTATPELPMVAQWSADRRDLALVPAALLTGDTTYVIEIPVTVTAQSGRALLNSYRTTFTTAAALQVLDASPVDGSRNVPLRSQVKAVFNQSLKSSSYTRVMAISPAIEGSYEFRNNALIFTPLTDYQPSTQYTVTLDPATEGINGGTLASSRSWLFETAAATAVVPEETAPTEPEAPKPEPIVPVSGPEDLSALGLQQNFAMEQAILTELNAQREQHQAAGIAVDPAIYETSMNYAGDLAIYGYQGGNHLDSTGRDLVTRIRDAGFTTDIYAENIYIDRAIDPQTVISRWVSRQPSILNGTYTLGGICVVQSGDRAIAVLLLVGSK